MGSFDYWTLIPLTKLINASFGWSYGKEVMNGVPDRLKGSYYANPTVDHPVVPEGAKKEHP